MSAGESISAWELTGQWYVGPPWRSKSDARAGDNQPWPKGTVEDLANDKSIVARDENRILFTEKVSADLWRERMEREGVAVAEKWNLRQVRLVDKGGALAKAMDEVGITPTVCEGYYVLDPDFYERGLALELVMALRKRIESLEQSP